MFTGGAMLVSALRADYNEASSCVTGPERREATMPTVADLLPTAQDLTMIFRVLVAFVLGGAIGWERQRLKRPAGLRTHMLVAAGSACFTVASIYGFEGAPRDPARLAA